MEIEDIKKIACRKEKNANAEKLREKILREKANVIKLKVAQDTARWDLNEKLQQVENNHEHLQQNMVKVQMQLEAASAQYQDELRFRPETLNKFNSTRAICEVLEDHVEKLRQTLSGYKANQAALTDALENLAKLVRDLRCKKQQADEKNKLLAESLQEKVALSSDHRSQLLQCFTAAKQQADSELAGVKTLLASAQTEKNNLLASVQGLNKDIDKYKHELAKNDEMVKNVQNETQKMIEQYNIQIGDASETIAQQEKKIKEAADACISLQQELGDEERLSNSVCNERNALQEEVAALEEKENSLDAVIDTLKIQLQDMVSAKAIAEGELEKLIEENKDLQRGTFDYIQQITNTKQQIQELQIQRNELDEEKTSMAIEIHRAEEELNQSCARLEQLDSEKKLLMENITGTENFAKSFRETMETKVKDMEIELQSRVKEVDSKTDTINFLLSEVKMGADVKVKLEADVDKLRKEFEAERQAANEMERKDEKEIKQLQEFNREKEMELEKHTSLMLEMSNEKERLLEKIQGMQQTVDNIRKELSGRTSQPAQEPVAMDDNAVIFNAHQTKLRSQKNPESSVPLTMKEELDKLFHLLSDSSRDEQHLDTSLVERRFSALSRGDHVPFAPVRRRPDMPSNLTPQQSQEVAAEIKNSTKNKNRKFFKQKREKN